MSRIIDYLSQNYPMSDFIQELLKESGLNQFSIVQLKNDTYLEKLKQFTIDNYSSFEHLPGYWKVSRQNLSIKVEDKKNASIDQFFLPGEVDLLKGISEEIGLEIKNNREFVKKYFTTKTVEQFTITDLMKSLNHAVTDTVQISENGFGDHQTFSKTINVKEENFEISATLKCSTCSKVVEVAFKNNSWETKPLRDHIENGDTVLVDIPPESNESQTIDFNQPSSSRQSDMHSEDVKLELNRELMKVLKNCNLQNKTIKRKVIEQGNGRYTASVICPTCSEEVTIDYHYGWVTVNFRRHLVNHCEESGATSTATSYSPDFQINSVVNIKTEEYDQSFGQSGEGGYENTYAEDTFAETFEDKSYDGTYDESNPPTDDGIEYIHVGQIQPNAMNTSNLPSTANDIEEIADSDQSDASNYSNYDNDTSKDHQLLHRMAMRTLVKQGFPKQKISCNVIYKDNTTSGVVICPICLKNISVVKRANSFLNSNFKRHLGMHQEPERILTEKAKKLKPKPTPELTKETVTELLARTVKNMFRGPKTDSKPIDYYVISENNTFIGVFVCPICSNKLSMSLVGNRFISSNLRRHLGRHNLLMNEKEFTLRRALSKRAPNLEDIDIAIQNTLPKAFLDKHKNLKRRIVQVNNKYWAKLQCPICNSVVTVKSAGNLWILNKFLRHIKSHDNHPSSNSLQTPDEIKDEEDELLGEATERSKLESRLRHTVEGVYGHLIEPNTLIEWEINEAKDKTSAKIKCPIPSCTSTITIAYTNRWINSNLVRHLGTHWKQ